MSVNVGCGGSGRRTSDATRHPAPYLAVFSHALCCECLQVRLESGALERHLDYLRSETLRGLVSSDNMVSEDMICPRCLKLFEATSRYTTIWRLHLVMWLFHWALRVKAVLEAAGTLLACFEVKA